MLKNKLKDFNWMYMKFENLAFLLSIIIYFLNFLHILRKYIIFYHEGWTK